MAGTQNGCNKVAAAKWRQMGVCDTKSKVWRSPWPPLGGPGARLNFEEDDARGALFFCSRPGESIVLPAGPLVYNDCPTDPCLLESSRVCVCVCGRSMCICV